MQTTFQSKCAFIASILFCFLENSHAFARMRLQCSGRASALSHSTNSRAYTEGCAGTTPPFHFPSCPQSKLYLHCHSKRRRSLTSRPWQSRRRRLLSHSASRTSCVPPLPRRLSQPSLDLLMKPPRTRMSPLPLEPRTRSRPWINSPSRMLSSQRLEMWLLPSMLNSLQVYQT